MGPGFMMAPLLQTSLMEDISILCTVPLYRGLHRDRAQVLLSVPESRVVFLFFLNSCSFPRILFLFYCFYLSFP